jgi:hypothetical protein
MQLQIGLKENKSQRLITLQGLHWLQLEIGMSKSQSPKPSTPFSWTSSFETS